MPGGPPALGTIGKRASGGGGRSGRSRPGQGGSGTNRRRLLAPLSGECKCSMATLDQRLHKSFADQRFRLRGPARHAGSPCGSRSTSPTFPRIPARFSASPPASGSRRTSSSRRAFRSPTAPSAAPAWTISIRSRSCATPAWTASRHGGESDGAGWSCSPPAQRLSYLDITRSEATTCCCSAASPPACRPRSHAAADARLVIPMRPGCARSMSRWPAPWHRRGAAADGGFPPRLVDLQSQRLISHAVRPTRDPVGTRQGAEISCRIRASRLS